MYTLIIRYELIREKLDVALGFIRFTLAENISFGRDLLHLKVDLSSFLYIYIYHVFEASIRRDSSCFIYVSVKRGDRDGRERTPFIFFILQKHTVLLWLYTNKSRPFAVSNDPLISSVWLKLMGVLLVLFAVKENTRDRTGAGFDLKEFNYQNCKKTQRLHLTFSTATLQILFMLKQQH